MTRVVDGSLGSTVPCSICGRRSFSHGTETAGRAPGADEPIFVAVPLCPACLYGDDVAAIEAAEARILRERGLEPALPSTAEVNPDVCPACGRRPEKLVRLEAFDRLVDLYAAKTEQSYERARLDVLALFGLEREP